MQRTEGDSALIEEQLLYSANRYDAQGFRRRAFGTEKQRCDTVEDSSS